MARVGYEQRASRGIARHQPVDGCHDVGTSWLEGPPPVFRDIRQHDHVTLVFGESALNQVSSHVPGIVNATGQGMAGTSVVDPNQ